MEEITTQTLKNTLEYYKRELENVLNNRRVFIDDDEKEFYIKELNSNIIDLEFTLRHTEHYLKPSNIRKV